MAPSDEGELTSAEYQSRDCSEVLRIVERHAQGIPGALSAESVRVYRFIQRRFRASGDLREDSVFQFVFRNFYGLDRAGLGPTFKSEFFELFQEQRFLKAPDVAEILERLRRVGTLRNNESLQFSFASKMAATINPDLPLYDSFIARLFAFSPASGPEPARRIKRFMAFYNALRARAQEAGQRDTIKSLIAEIDIAVGGWTDIRPAKQIDFIFWTAGRLEARRSSGSSIRAETVT